MQRKPFSVIGFSNSINRLRLALALSFSQSPKIDPNSTTKIEGKKEKKE
jgi:hypothetical protein